MAANHPKTSKTMHFGFLIFILFHPRTSCWPTLRLQEGLKGHSSKTTSDALPRPLSRLTLGHQGGGGTHFALVREGGSLRWRAKISQKETLLVWFGMLCRAEGLADQGMGPILPCQGGAIRGGGDCTTRGKGNTKEMKEKPEEKKNRKREKAAPSRNQGWM